MTTDTDRALLEKALLRAFYLGQTYWQQIDSESYAQNRRADETRLKFEALVRDTCDVIRAAAAAMDKEQTNG